MAQAIYSIKLQDTAFPLLSEEQTRTVIGSEIGKAPSASDMIGIAYCHNVMPTKYGLTSVGYLDAVPPYSILGAPFYDVRTLYDEEGNLFYLAWDAAGYIFHLTGSPLAWVPILGSYVKLSPLTISLPVTIATVKGVSYICFPRNFLCTFDAATSTINTVSLIGISMLNVAGIVASSGYLIVHDELDISWSSLIDPLDFVPSQVTGAGGGSVAGLAGPMLFITSNSLGLLIYTEANIIAGTYTGNSRYPFKFREVDSSKGGISLDRIAYEANSTTQFVYSKAGLQTITSQRAEVLFPEVTDFLAGGKLESYDEVTKQYTYTYLASDDTMEKKIKFIAARYLVVSYGAGTGLFTHALVYDTALGKVGKLKITHTDVFELIADQPEISKESIALLLADGAVKVLDFTSATANGVLVLGKLQALRTHMISLLGVEAENIPDEGLISVHSQASLDGKNFTNIDGSLSYSSGDLKEFAFRSTAKNHSIVFTGKFNLTAVQVRYTLAGRR